MSAHGQTTANMKCSSRCKFTFESQIFYGLMYPTIERLGKPFVTCTSTITNGVSIPERPLLYTMASDILYFLYFYALV